MCHPNQKHINPSFRSNSINQYLVVITAIPPIRGLNGKTIKVTLRKYISTNEHVLKGGCTGFPFPNQTGAERSNVKAVGKAEKDSAGQAGGGSGGWLESQALISPWARGVDVPQGVGLEVALVPPAEHCGDDDDDGSDGPNGGQHCGDDPQVTGRVLHHRCQGGDTTPPRGAQPTTATVHRCAEHSTHTGPHAQSNTTHTAPHTQTQHTHWTTRTHSNTAHTLDHTHTLKHSTHTGPHAHAQTQQTHAHTQTQHTHWTTRTRSNTADTRAHSNTAREENRKQLCVHRT